MKNPTEKEIQFKSKAELNFVVIMIGIAFILIGFSSLFGIVKLNSLFALAIALSGTFFVISDIIQYFIDKYSSNGYTYSILNALKKVALAFSILSLLAIPYLNFQFKNPELLATAFSIIAIGLTIVNLSLNQKRGQEEAHERMISGLETPTEQTQIIQDNLEHTEKVIQDLLPYEEDDLEEKSKSL